VSDQLNEKDFFEKYPWFKLVASVTVVIVLVQWLDAFKLLFVAIQLIFIPLALLCALGVVTEESYRMIKAQLSSREFASDLKEHLASKKEAEGC
jgi:hypothetical protein